MKCPKCNSDFELKIATKAEAKNCKIMAEMTSVLTVMCDSCNNLFQVPMQNKRIYSIKNE